MSYEEDNNIHWERLRNGDKQALFALYNNTYSHLLRFGLKICGSDELVKDCITQLFLQLWTRHQTLRPVTNVPAYLFTALKRQLLDQLAYQSKIHAAIHRMTDKEAERELSYEEIIIQVQQDEELKQRLQQALKALTPRQIELIRLKFFEGLSYEQIAAQTSQTVKTAYNTIYDAIKALRKMLK
ncbi:MULTISPECIES: RNA polymerase sigma factor [Chitinophaga]|uniref:RNA polymerase sigma factor n=1 Tax=Chitinophaga TaxID=79328 RepID=UPI000DBA377D|nr:sigma-70 family RNA polymerase sigma factor [Chitinophaga ginsengisegetis]MDR6566942.1 RNA polymerase sigma-70 factor (ECF subfamily) [Chitinophaga ginsengisegetis]MDR6646672.1 RNA polymerase sigma-70 factor (ECF subfamily) [Chitinophaga ginsengisegetis]MDR6653022.1 RNA polymerase sigma-70 factor (ECF subfamily) [Chitinophaga ginsengisegetis]